MTPEGGWGGGQPKHHTASLGGEGGSRLVGDCPANMHWEVEKGAPHSHEDVVVCSLTILEER